MMADPHLVKCEQARAILQTMQDKWPGISSDDIKAMLLELARHVTRYAQQQETPLVKTYEVKS
jgi:hypothetical protein